jgi:hypothetical protein
MYRLISFCLALLIVPVIGTSQDSDLGNWYLLFGNKKLNDKINWHHEVQYRNYNIAGDLEQLLLRTGLGYDLGDNANLLQGYGFIRSENYINDTDKSVVNEHRLFQQLITKQSVGKLRMQHRYRFEQRFVEGDFRLRFRYFLGLGYPLWKSAETPQELYLSAYNEIFLDPDGNAYDRNRTYGGLGYKLNDRLRFELGYMNQFLNGLNRDQLNVVTFFNW